MENFASIIAWKGKQGTTSGSSNNDGSTASTVSANQTAGFSIFKFTGTNSNGTVGHGLGAVPEMYILKIHDHKQVNWMVYHKDLETLLANNNEFRT